MRHAIRSLRATPSFTLVALATLTLAIGASTAIFSIVDAVILRALPFPRAERLVALGEANLKVVSPRAENLVAPQNFLDWRAQQTAFSGIAAIGYASVSLKAEGGQEPETLLAQAVTSEFFPVLGIAPLVGRTFAPENERPPHARVAVISYRLWQRRFNGDPNIVGRHLPERRFNMLVIGLFGLLGIVIACVGIYGVIAYVVTLRTPEIGIRAALGAAPGTILWSVLRMAALYLGGGLAIGVPAAWMLGTFVAGFLFEVQPRDPWIFAAVTAVLVATGMLAALLPARRAARVDPVTALRLE